MKVSAGILLYRNTNTIPEYFLAHPGGPFFIKKDKGWWTIPKGEPLEGEEYLDTALREFKEETGYAPQPPYIPLEPIIQKGGKKVFCWAAEGNLNAEDICCNTFDMIWPPKSGIIKQFPEIDRGGWFLLPKAIALINERQAAFIHQLEKLII